MVTLGSIELARVVEFSGPLRTVSALFPDVDPGFWRDNADWLAPDYWDPATDAYQANVQTWVLRSGGRTILVDTGIGNDRERPQIPVFSHLRTDFLDRLSAIVAPAEVDVVVTTHIHYDHVGWNTTLDDGRWVPTFPNAEYLVPRADHDYFHPENAARMRPPRTEDEKLRFDGIKLVFADSIAPIEAAGQLSLWDGEHRIDDALTVIAAPGHTPGSSVLRLRDGAASALFVGDMLHSPAQIGNPDWSSIFDLDPAAARETRRHFVTEAAEAGTVVFPAHFSGPGGARIARGATTEFEVAEWLDVRPS
jgi:glyoxylase-like metal-dependent hydrolase (beta-lactamase superfamily II)